MLMKNLSEVMERYVDHKRWAHWQMKWGLGPAASVWTVHGPGLLTLGSHLIQQLHYFVKWQLQDWRYLLYFSISCSSKFKIFVYIHHHSFFFHLLILKYKMFSDFLFNYGMFCSEYIIFIIIFEKLKRNTLMKSLSIGNVNFYAICIKLS